MTDRQERPAARGRPDGKVLYLVGVSINEYVWDAKRQEMVVLVRYSEDVSDEYGGDDASA